MQHRHSHITNYFTRIKHEKDRVKDIQNNILQGSPPVNRDPSQLNHPSHLVNSLRITVIQEVAINFVVSGTMIFWDVHIKDMILTVAVDNPRVTLETPVVFHAVGRTDMDNVNVIIRAIQLRCTLKQSPIRESNQPRPKRVRYLQQFN